MIDLGDYVGTGVGPVAMKTGYLQKYQSMVQVRHQVIVVLMSDWTVYCLDHNLKILWRIKVTSKETKSISVSWVEDKRSDLEWKVVVMVGGEREGREGAGLNNYFL